MISGAVREPVQAGDIFVVTSKIVSKAEGRFLNAENREAAITAETVRVVASRAGARGNVTRIVQNRQGIVAAAAGVDASNTPEGTILLLQEDPDRSARELASRLRDRFGVDVGVIISDTLGRPWREGQTDCAIGAGGVRVIDDHRGAVDAEGRTLEVTAPCVGDELAAACDLVKRKTSRVPVAVVRGRGDLVGSMDLPGAASIVRDLERDLFRLGTREAFEEGYAAGVAAAENLT
ncbi:coenzyme F420-0:L-glutamate ligase [Leucobacter sp. Z1108]|uniref:coenzyme F420-0:L-glutamate ligase n=1 Tax=Leucobacter sp. Z1108 TaxID=3439066 RepID=UPI00403DE4B4